VEVKAVVVSSTPSSPSLAATDTSEEAWTSLQEVVGVHRVEGKVEIKELQSVQKEVNSEVKMEEVSLTSSAGARARWKLSVVERLFGSPLKHKKKEKEMLSEIKVEENGKIDNLKDPMTTVRPKLVKRVPKSPSRPVQPSGSVQEASSSNPGSLRRASVKASGAKVKKVMSVKASEAKYLLCWKGRAVGSIREKTDVSISIKQEENRSSVERVPVVLLGSREGVKQADAQIAAICSSTKVIPVTREEARLVIGGKGQTLKEIQETSGALLLVREGNLFISGQEEEVREAREVVEAILEELV